MILVSINLFLLLISLGDFSVQAIPVAVLEPLNLTANPVDAQIHLEAPPRGIVLSANIPKKIADAVSHSSTTTTSESAPTTTATASPTPTTSSSRTTTTTTTTPSSIPSMTLVDTLLPTSGPRLPANLGANVEASRKRLLADDDYVAVTVPTKPLSTSSPSLSSSSTDTVLLPGAPGQP